MNPLVTTAPPLTKPVLLASKIDPLSSAKGPMGVITAGGTNHPKTSTAGSSPTPVPRSTIGSADPGLLAARAAPGQRLGSDEGQVGDEHHRAEGDQTGDQGQ